MQLIAIWSNDENVLYEIVAHHFHMRILVS